MSPDNDASASPPPPAADGSLPLAKIRKPITRIELLGYLRCWPLYIMLTLMVLEALLAAATTWLVIKAGRDVANDEFLIADLLWILAAQSASYIAGAISWMFAERAGFRAFGLYMLRFASDNRQETRLLHDKTAREQVEPFLTGETFYTIFHLIYEMESQLKLLLGLIFNALVLGMEIDGSLPVAYDTVFAVLMLAQWSMRKRVADIYLDNQRHNNRVTAHGYTAWDNVLTGNAYNLRLWISEFKVKLRDCLRVQIKAIMTREGISAGSGIFALAIIFTVMAYIAIKSAGDTELLIALAATLPRQIEMTNSVHELASGWNDVLAVWTRFGGIVDNMQPQADPRFTRRIKFDRLTLKEGEEVLSVGNLTDALQAVAAQPHGRILVRGGNGSGKSTLLTALKASLQGRAYYWPTNDRLAFDFSAKFEEPVEDFDDEDDIKEAVKKKRRAGFSSGERQIRSLQEIVTNTKASIYLLDEWDANLDAHNRAAAEALVAQLAMRARVIEISHRDRV